MASMGFDTSPFPVGVIGIGFTYCFDSNAFNHSSENLTLMAGAQTLDVEACSMMSIILCMFFLGHALSRLPFSVILRGTGPF